MAKTKHHMRVLYESDQWVVVHYPWDLEDGEQVWGFEVIEKPEEESTFLHGCAAAAFHERIKGWQLCTPTAEAVEATLDCFTQLGRVPLVAH